MAPQISATAANVPAVNVFEGPEKKLDVLFAPRRPASALSSPSCSEADTSNGAGSDSDSDMASHGAGCHRRRGLRALSRVQINSVLEAASCTVLSVKSNDSIDAYLLSESSLFVSEFRLMIKTCGTTTLLHALPTIMRLAVDILGLTVAAVQYSRVGFLFPEQQHFPHDSFENEVSFLDRHLAVQGRTFEMGTADFGATWHLYMAHFDPAPTTSRNSTAQLAMCRRQALEIFMFDLDPSAMAHFQFHTRPDLSGSDKAIAFTTKASGIDSLLKGDGDVIDAFNFEPCGYSMNALFNDAYYTVHVSPEPEASYVSFETSLETRELATIIATAVKVFRPGCFTVSFVGTHDCAALFGSPKAPVQWPILGKLLGLGFRRAGDPPLLNAGGGCWATVASYVSSQSRTQEIGQTVDSIVSGPVLSEETDYHGALREVISRYGAKEVLVGDAVQMARATLAGAENIGERPTFLVDLAAVERRTLHLRKLHGDRVSMRYAVRCNSDPAVLSLLHGLGVEFEAVSMAEVDILRSVGVFRDHITLATPMLTSRVLRRLDEVGTVAVFGKPSRSLLNALESGGVAVEIRVPPGAVAESVEACRDILSVTDRLHRFAVDCEPDVSQLAREEMLGILRSSLQTVSSVLAQLPDHVSTRATVSIGEMYPGSRNGSLLSFTREIVTLGQDLPHIALDPGRYIVGPSVSLVVSVIGRRSRRGGADSSEIGVEPAYNYYLNDGAYGAFSSVLTEGSAANGEQGAVPSPRVLGSVMGSELNVHDTSSTGVARGRNAVSVDDEVHPMKDQAVSVLFGPTCDALDRIWVGKLPTLHVGDLLLFPNMGAYAASAVSAFNGFARRFDVSYLSSQYSLISG